MRSRVDALSVTVATLACVLASACDTPSSSPLAPERCETCIDVFVVAHEDDDVLFMNPDIADAIAAEHHVTVAYTTAGNLGDPTRDGYWIDRERGALQAYTFAIAGASATAYDDDLASIAPGWTASLVSLGALRAVQYARDNVTLVFLRLSDFQEQCLWEQVAGCSSLNPNPAPPYVAITRACPGNATACPAGTALASQDVTRDDLIDALAAVIERVGATSLGALDASDLHVDMLGEPIYTGDEAGYADHWDHVYSAKFAVEAATRVPAPPDVRLYRGYTLHRADANLADDVAIAKQEMFAHYAMFDGKIVRPPTPSDYLDDIDRHVAGDYKLSAPGSWERRRIAAATLPAETAALATASGACLGATLAAVDCATAPAWAATRDRELQLVGTTTCVAVDAATAAVELAPCGDATAGTTIFPLDSGQVRAAGDTCLALSPGATLLAAPCAAAQTDGHVADVPAPDQLWTLGR